jgi:WD40 repeat protein
VAPESGYDAFISYSHRHDEWLAQALQRGLERFAKPWYRARALRVFRDTANLAASPELWGSIERALSASRWFILLASPDAARSPWVNREVEWWLAHRPPDQLLVVGTAPGLRWDEGSADWAADAPVPPALHGAFRAEPLWADLSGLCSGGPRDRIPEQRLASVAAPLRGVPRDALIGEHLREHRRALRLARGAAVVLAALTVLAAAASVVAVNQRDAARTQARIATSRQLAALSETMSATHLDAAQQLAVAAYQTDDNPQTRSALFQAVAASPSLMRYLPAGAPVTALAASDDANVAVAGTADGRLVWFNLTTGKRVSVRAIRGPVTTVAVSADGRAVAASGGSGVVAWTTKAPHATPVAAQSADAVAISPSGRLIATLKVSAGRSATITVHDWAAGHERQALTLPGAAMIGFPDESSLAMVADDGEWVRMNPETLQVTASFIGHPQAPFNYYQAASSPDGGYGGYAKFGEVNEYSTSNSGVHLGGSVPDAPASALAIRPDGKYAAVSESGTIYVTPMTRSSTSSGRTWQWQFTGNSDTTLIAFLGNSTRLVSATGSSVALWDPDQVSRLAQPTGIRVASTYNAAGPPVLLSPPDGSWLSVVGGFNQAWLYRPAHGPAPAVTAADNAQWYVPMRSGDEPLLLGTDDTGKGLVLADARGRILRSWSAGACGTPAAAAMLPDGNQFVVVGSDMSLCAYRISSPAVRRVMPASGSLSVSLRGEAISPDGASAVMSLAAGASGSGRVIWVDLRTGASRQVGSGDATSVLFAARNLLLQHNDGSLEVWDSGGRRLLRTLPGTGGSAPSLAASPDGTLVARLRDDGTASITDLASGDVLGTFALAQGAVVFTGNPWYTTALMFTPDGRYLLTATSGGGIVRYTVNPSDLVRKACATVGGGLTPAQWRQYVATDPPSHLPCAS